MSLKLITLLVVTCIAASQTQGASIKKPVKDERVAALYVKESSNGELRFLGGGLGGGNINAQLNNYITQQQNLLEQLRPTTGTTGTNIFGTGTGTGTALTGTGTGGFGTVNGVTPIVVNTGGTSTTNNNNNAVNNAISNSSSPVAALLPQIIAQAVVNRRGPNNNRRRRRPNRGGRPNVYVIRPSA